MVFIEKHDSLGSHGVAIKVKNNPMDLQLSIQEMLNKIEEAKSKKSVVKSLSK